jgi:hypothetical protein
MHTTTINSLADFSRRPRRPRQSGQNRLRQAPDAANGAYLGAYLGEKRMRFAGQFDSGLESSPRFSAQPGHLS